MSGPMKKMPSQQWFEKNTAWRKKGLALIEKWLGDLGEAPYEQLIIKRFAKLESFIGAAFIDQPPPDPIDPYDAAFLIVAPRGAALRLARRLFSGVPGWMSELVSDDLTSFNMDWFHPPK